MEEWKGKTKELKQNSSEWEAESMWFLNLFKALSLVKTLFFLNNYGSLETLEIKL